MPSSAGERYRPRQEADFAIFSISSGLLTGAMVMGLPPYEPVDGSSVCGIPLYLGDSVKVVLRAQKIVAAIASGRPELDRLWVSRL